MPAITYDYQPDGRCHMRKRRGQRAGERCGKRTATGCAYTCTDHEHKEQGFRTPPLCGQCLGPIDPASSQLAYCSTACRHKRNATVQGCAPWGAAGCQRCGHGQVWQLAPDATICPACGYCSDMPERVVPGMITKSRSKVPAEVVAASLRAGWRAELVAKPAEALI